MEKCFVGEVGTEIYLDCGRTITGATNVYIKVRKPDETEHDWSAEVSGTKYVKYTIQAGDFDQSGDYRLQAYFTLGSWVGRGTTAVLPVYDNFAIWE